MWQQPSSSPKSFSRILHNEGPDGPSAQNHSIFNCVSSRYKHVGRKPPSKEHRRAVKSDNLMQTGIFRRLEMG